MGRILPYHAAVAQTNGLHLVAYAGGSQVASPAGSEDEVSRFLIAFSYAPQMGVLYEALLKGWTAQGGQLFMAHLDVQFPTDQGAEGALRYLEDQNPSWDALQEYE